MGALARQGRAFKSGARRLPRVRPLAEAGEREDKEDPERERESESERERERERESERARKRERETETERERDRETERSRERQRETEREEGVVEARWLGPGWV